MKSALFHRTKPIAARAKALVTLGVVTSCLWHSASASFADTSYSLVITPASANEIFKWEDASWSGGDPGAYPQAGDTANIIRNNGGNTFLDVLAGDITIANLTYNGGTNQLRIRNNGFGVASALHIASGLSVEKGLLIFARQGSSHQFSIETNSTSVANGATLGFGISGGGVAFKSLSTTISQGGAIEMYSPPTDNGVYTAHFGDVTNNGTFNLFGGSGISTASYDIFATSLSGSSTSVVTTTTTGAGSAPKPTLRIIGNSSTQATYNGIISGAVGSIAVSKEGSGIQIFSNANTYTGGTIISGGVLAVTNTTGSGVGGGPVEVRDQGVLSGNGIVALTNETIHVKAGGNVAPGAFDDSGFSTLRLSGAATTGPILTMEEETSFTFRLGAGDQSDQIQFLDFTSGDWIINNSGGIAINATGAEVGGIYTIFTFEDGNGDAIASGLTDGLFAGAGLEDYTVLFHYGNEQGEAGYGTITMEVIPEPGTVGLMLLGGALFLGSCRLRGQRAL